MNTSERKTGSNGQASTVRSANKRGAARLAAVQALYQMELTGASITAIVAEYEDLRLGKEVDGDSYLEADHAYFRRLVSGVVGEQGEIDEAIRRSLVKDWPLSRIDTTLRSILRCGCFEIMSLKDVPAKVILSEYIDIAKAFFEADEPRMVNGVLNAIAKTQRVDEVGV